MMSVDAVVDLTAFEKFTKGLLRGGNVSYISMWNDVCICFN